MSQTLKNKVSQLFDRIFLRHIIRENRRNLRDLRLAAQQQEKNVATLTASLSHLMPKIISEVKLEVEALRFEVREQAQNPNLSNAIKRLDVVEEVLLKKIDAAVRDFKSTERIGFRQVEALNSLVSVLNIDSPLPATRGWAASPDFLLYIYDHVLRLKPALVVELGSGISTLVVALALKKNGYGAVVSIDHEDRYALETEKHLAEHDLTSIAKVHRAGLSSWEPANITKLGEKWQWYDIPTEVSSLQGIDLLIVDGPPERSGKFARYPAVPDFWNRLATGGYVLLDDTIRPDETAAAHAWAEEYGMDLEIFPDFEKGLAVLRKDSERK